MNLQVPLEKLRFIVQELELSFMIAKALPDDHRARVFSRRLAIRAKDFIEHSRRLRKPIQETGGDPRAFHKLKEVYATTFGEYYPLLRDRLGAHMQDIDLLERLQLWSEIEVVKLGYLVDGAREIYESLEGLKLAGYLPYESLPEMTDSAFQEILDGWKAGDQSDAQARIRLDVVAGTRPNELNMINETLPHVRAKQIVSLLEWTSLADELVSHFTQHRAALRIAKAQLLTDLVSLADCLFTREVSPGAKQELPGLDHILRQAEWRPDASWLTTFKNAFRFDETVASLREVRNKVGGHLDSDASTALPLLVASLDDLDILDVRRFLDKLRAVFEATCRSVLFLGIYLSHGTSLRGILAPGGASEFVKPFDDSFTEVAENKKHVFYDWGEATCHERLDAWLAGQKQDDAGHYFYTAFGLAQCAVESGTRGPLAFELKIAHQVLLERFKEASIPEQLQILDLVEESSRGNPRELAEVLFRLLESKSAFDNLDVRLRALHILGRLPLKDDEPVKQTLCDALTAASSEAAGELASTLYAFLSRAKGGPALKNPVQRDIYSLELEPRTQELSAVTQFHILLRCASAYSDGSLTISGGLEREYEALRDAVRTGMAALVPALSPDVLRFVDCHDYVSLSVVLGMELEKQGHTDEARETFLLVTTGAIRMVNLFEVRASARAYRALALLRLGEFIQAREEAASVTRAYPANIALKLACIEIMADTGLAPEKVVEMLSYVRRAYVLNKENEEKVDELERGLRRTLAS